MKTPSKQPRSKRVAVVALALLSLIAGWGLWSPASTPTPKPEATPRGTATFAAPAMRSTEPSDASRYRVLHYTFSEPSGQAEASWLLAEGTEVALADGTIRAVGALKQGDQIRLAQDQIGSVERVSEPFIPRGPPAWQTAKSGTEFRRVLGTVKHTSTTVVDLHYGGEMVTATPNHPFWEFRRNDWVEAGTLVVGDLLLAADGAVVPIERVETRHGQFTVYNLEVDGQHSYFVGKTGVLVHNGPPGNPCAPPIEIVIDGRKYPGSATHAQDAIDAGVSPHGVVDRPGAKPRRGGRLENEPRVPGMDRDEFPPAVLDNGTGGHSVRPVLPGDNRGAGSSIRHQLDGVPDGTPVKITPINVPPRKKP